MLQRSKRMLYAGFAITATFGAVACSMTPQRTAAERKADKTAAQVGHGNVAPVAGAGDRAVAVAHCGVDASTSGAC